MTTSHRLFNPALLVAPLTAGYWLSPFRGLSKSRLKMDVLILFICVPFISTRGVINICLKIHDAAYKEKNIFMSL
jgi:hypothetical protein